MYSLYMKETRYSDFTVSLGLERNHANLGGRVPNLAVRAYANEGYETVLDRDITPHEHSLIIAAIDEILDLKGLLTMAGGLQRSYLKHRLQSALEAEEARVARIDDYRSRLEQM